MGVYLVPSSLGKTGEDERRRLVEASGSPAPEDWVVSSKQMSSPVGGVVVLGSSEDPMNMLFHTYMTRHISTSRKQRTLRAPPG